VNVGNIYFEQKKYLQAIKMYRMALDQSPNSQLDLKLVPFFIALTLIVAGTKS
jgi:tetratricopeptide (TPR) repeat protein